jgi:hypothetical protein
LTASPTEIRAGPEGTHRPTREPDRHPTDAAEHEIYDTRTQNFSASAYRDLVMKSLPRIATLSLMIALVGAACGSDSDDASDDTPTTSAASLDPGDATVSGDDPAATTTPADPSSTSIAAEGTTTTTTAGSGSTGLLADGTLTTDGGITSAWSLTATPTSLCFEAGLSHPDPATADAIGDGVSNCLEPAGGLDQLNGGLSVDVGTVDGEKTIGFLWGRVAPEVISLTIEHTDGSQTPIEVLDGPTDVGVFAYVVEISSIPPVQDLDAVSGTQIEGSEPIRSFLRAGPTYPVASPPPTPTSPDYPVS